MTRPRFFLNTQTTDPLFNRPFFDSLPTYLISSNTTYFLSFNIVMRRFRTRLGANFLNNCPYHNHTAANKKNPSFPVLINLCGGSLPGVYNK